MSIQGANNTDEAMRKMLSDLLIDNAQLRIRVNSVIRNVVNTSAAKPEEKEDAVADGAVPKKTVLNWLLDR
jgi:hypothetical protein